MMIEIAGESRKNELIELYNHCFPGENEFCNYFFDNIWNANSSYIYLDGNNIAAMLNILPLTVDADGDGKSCAYLYALGTYSQYRGRGIMGELLRYAKNECEKAGLFALMLISENDSLFAFYEKYGYKKAFNVSKNKCEPKKLPYGYEIEITGQRFSRGLLNIYEKQMDGLCFGVRDESFFKNLSDVYGEGYVLIAPDGKMCAYAFGCGADGERFFATEAIGEGAGILMAALAEVSEMPSAEWCGVPTEQNSVPQGCVLNISGDEKCGNTYLNLMFN